MPARRKTPDVDEVAFYEVISQPRNEVVGRHEDEQTAATEAKRLDAEVEKMGQATTHEVRAVVLPPPPNVADEPRMAPVQAKG